MKMITLPPCRVRKVKLKKIRHELSKKVLQMSSLSITLIRWSVDFIRGLPISLSNPCKCKLIVAKQCEFISHMYGKIYSGNYRIEI